MIPEPYWTLIDWKSLGAFTVAAGGIAFPFIKAWREGRIKAQLVNVRALETALERQERIAREQYERVCAERDYLGDRVREMEQRRRDIETEGDRMHSAARNMEAWAHWYRHGWIGVAQRFRALVEMVGGAAGGSIAPERVKAILVQINESLPEAPPDVPWLRDVATIKPPS